MTRILISLLILLLTPIPAHASTRCEPVITGNGPSLHPEGVTYDPVRHRFLVGSVTLATGPGHFANDVALAPDGTAFVTDSISGTIYRVTPDGAFSTLVQHPDLAQPSTGGWGLNGIAHVGDKLVAALSGARKLAVIPLADPRNVTTTTAPIGAPDGLLVLSRNRLLLVDNTAANRVVEVRTHDRWRTADIVREVAWPDKAPTTLTNPPCGAYAVAGRLDVLLGGGRSDEFVLRKV